MSEQAEIVSEEQTAQDSIERSAAQATETESITRRTSLSAGFTIGEFSGLMALSIPLLYLLLAFVEGAAYIWRPIGILLYAVLMFVAVFLVFMVAITREDEIKDKYPDAVELFPAFALIGVIAMLVSFSQICRHLSSYVGGFVAAQSGYWHWLRFGVANLLEGVLLDIPAIYDWNISEIQPVAFWSRTLLFLFRASWEFLMIGTLLRQFQIVRDMWSRPQQAQYKSYFAFILPRAGHFLLAILWSIPLAVSVGAIANDGLSIGASWSAVRLGTPVAFGIWLTWQSLRALGLPGKWNKLLGLAAIVGGIWLVRQNWLAFQEFLGL